MKYSLKIQLTLLLITTLLQTTISRQCASQTPTIPSFNSMKCTKTQLRRIIKSNFIKKTIMILSIKNHPTMTFIIFTRLRAR